MLRAGEYGSTHWTVWLLESEYNFAYLDYEKLAILSTHECR